MSGLFSSTTGVKKVTVLPTFYKILDDGTLEAERFGFARETLRDYQQLNAVTNGAYPVVVVDKSPLGIHRTVYKAFEDFGPHLHLLEGCPDGGIAPQSFYGLQYALGEGAELFDRHAPEKRGWANLMLQERIVAELRSGIDVLAVGRDAEGFATLPYNQRQTESVMGRVLGRLRHEATGRRLCLDSASGYRAFTRDGAEHTLKFDWRRYGNLWQFEWLSWMQAVEEGDVEVGELLLPYLTADEIRLHEDGSPFFDENRIAQADTVMPLVIDYALANGWVFDLGEIDWPVRLDQLPA